MLGKSIRKTRKDMGMSLDALAQTIAELTGETLTSESVRKWEVGKASPEREKWAAIEQALGQPEGWVFALISFPGSSTTTQTTTGNRSPAQQHVGMGTIYMDEGGITCTGLDERHAPSPQIDTDEWAELLYWLRRHPTMMRRIVEEARRIGLKMDDAVNG